MNESHEGVCRICTAEGRVREIGLYINGSEGFTVCHACEMAMVAIVRTMQSVGSRSEKAFTTRRNPSSLGARDVFPSSGTCREAVEQIIQQRPGQCFTVVQIHQVLLHSGERYIPDTVRTNLDRLAAEGVISVVHGKHKQHPNKYHIPELKNKK